MSNKYFFGMAVAALALSSCTQDEMVSMQKDAISYSVFAKNQTRAENSYCAVNLPEGFKVYARTTNTATEDQASNSKLYINGDDIKKNGSNWIDQSGTRYWPETGNLDFVAHVNGGENFSFNLSGQSTFDNFVVNGDVTQQLDLMYAVNPNVTKTSSTVNLNFRHALSQVCFKANNKTSNLRITINSVTVGNLNGEGTYTLPTDITDVNILDTDHNNGITDEPDGVNRGGWEFVKNETLKSYTAKVNVNKNGENKVVMAPESGLADLTTNTQGHNVQAGWANVMMLMPQQKDAWVPSSKKLEGAYFKLNIKMENIVTDDDGKQEATTIFGGENGNDVYVPVTIDWKEGVRYIYTFNFEDGGNGGWTDPTNPKPALVDIDLAMTCDDFLTENPDEDGTDVEAYNYAFIKFNSNYPTDANKDSWVKNVDIKTINESYSYAITNEPTFDELPAQYSFMGWAKDANAKIPDYVVHPSDEETNVLDIDFKESNKRTIDLYAVWKEGYTVTFDSNGVAVADLDNAALFPSPFTGVENTITIPNYKPEIDVQFDILEADSPIRDKDMAEEMVSLADGNDTGLETGGRPNRAQNSRLQFVGWSTKQDAKIADILPEKTEVEAHRVQDNLSAVPEFEMVEGETVYKSGETFSVTKHEKLYAIWAAELNMGDIAQEMTNYTKVDILTQTRSQISGLEPATSTSIEIWTTYQKLYTVDLSNKEDNPFWLADDVLGNKFLGWFEIPADPSKQTAEESYTFNLDYKNPETFGCPFSPVWEQKEVENITEAESRP